MGSEFVCLVLSDKGQSAMTLVSGLGEAVEERQAGRKG